MQKFPQQMVVMQQTKNNFYQYWGLTFLCLFALSSCGYSGQSGLNGVNFTIGVNVTPIRELKPQSDKATVYIQGKVNSSVPLIKQQVYQISDSSGKIWVLTKQTGWKEGQEVVVKGKINYQSIPLAGKEFGEIYLEEE
ncbi:MAG: hypothetical protein KME38_02580 [Spirirestis rafaelensis WJT71-NPBG6]|jgi:uncharacterized protein YdeI (BOF family)|nr:hypothetical protein [Spirirestis rafaelensis WJT71-NPBG6]